MVSGVNRWVVNKQTRGETGANPCFVMGICQFASPFLPCVERSKELLSLSHSHRDISHFANSCPQQIKKRYSTKWTYYSEVQVSYSA